VQALATQSGIALLLRAVVLTRTEPHRGESNAPSEDRKESMDRHCLAALLLATNAAIRRLQNDLARKATVAEADEAAKQWEGLLS